MAATQDPKALDLAGGTPERIRRLISNSVTRLDLNLAGLRVLTEAGSGAYALTPAIALAAGADEVIAVSRDSVYGAAVDNLESASAAAQLFQAADRLTGIVGRPSAIDVARVDIITNLGFVRPIDEALLGHAKSTAAVPLMCEAWEWREGDVDLAACRRLGIPVLGTNEDAPAVQVFAFCGPLAGRLIFDAGFELWHCSVVVLSPDRFGPVIAKWLVQAGAMVHLTDELQSSETCAALARADVLLLADYGRESAVIGRAGVITAESLAAAAPGVTVVQFAGAVDEEALLDVGIPVYPRPTVGAVRMARTLAHIGPRPVVELHAAGLKVGELACRARLTGLSSEEVESRLSTETDLCQRVR